MLLPLIRKLRRLAPPPMHRLTNPRKRKFTIRNSQFAILYDRVYQQFLRNPAGVLLGEIAGEEEQPRMRHGRYCIDAQFLDLRQHSRGMRVAQPFLGRDFHAMDHAGNSTRNTMDMEERGIIMAGHEQFRGTDRAGADANQTGVTK